jgi:hypothetical protein
MEQVIDESSFREEPLESFLAEFHAADRPDTGAA